LNSPIEDAVGELHRSAVLLAEYEAPRFASAASQSELDALGRSLDLALPPDLLELLRLHRAIVAMDVRNGYWIGASETGALVLPNQPREALLNNELIAVVPVATDGGGNAFVQSLRDGTIWRLDHETAVCAMVGAHLPAFLLRVAEDWMHASHGDTDWRYLV
jgi:hypothetical protein